MFAGGKEADFDRVAIATGGAPKGEGLDVFTRLDHDILLLCVEFALAVRRIWARRIVLADVLIGLLLMYRAEHAERTEEHVTLSLFALLVLQRQLHQRGSILPRNSRISTDG